MVLPQCNTKDNLETLTSRYLEYEVLEINKLDKNTSFEICVYYLKWNFYRKKGQFSTDRQNKKIDLDHESEINPNIVFILAISNWKKGDFYWLFYMYHSFFFETHQFIHQYHGQT